LEEKSRKKESQTGEKSQKRSRAILARLKNGEKSQTGMENQTGRKARKGTRVRLRVRLGRKARQGGRQLPANASTDLGKNTRDEVPEWVKCGVALNKIEGARTWCVQ
jgi:hypothetical protein